MRSTSNTRQADTAVTIPALSQDIILEMMLFLGYEIPGDGQCFGISGKKLEPILLEDSDPEDQLTVYENRIDAIVDMHKKYVAKYLAEYHYLKNYRSSQELNDFINSKRKIIDAEIAADRAKLPREQQPVAKQKHIDILAFFDGVTITQDMNNHADLFSDKTYAFIQQRLDLSMKLTESVALQKQKGAVNINNFTATYNTNELTDYFTSLRKSLSARRLQTSVGFELTCLDHTICFGYSPKRGWVLGDPNNLQDKSLPLANNDNTMARLMMFYLQGSELDETQTDARMVITTDVYVTGKNYQRETQHDPRQTIVQPVFIKAWHNSPEMQQIESIDADKLLQRDMLGNTLYQQAITSSPALIKKILGDDILTDRLKSTRKANGLNELDVGFLVAASRYQLDTLEHLTQTGVDIMTVVNSLCRANPTQLRGVEDSIRHITFCLEQLIKAHPERAAHYTTQLQAIRNVTVTWKTNIAEYLEPFAITFSQALKMPANLLSILLTGTLKTTPLAYVELKNMLFDFPQYADSILRTVLQHAPDSIPDTYTLVQALDAFPQHRKTLLLELYATPEHFKKLIPDSEALNTLKPKLADDQYKQLTQWVSETQTQRPGLSR